ncbi:MAG: hypothetical protein ABSC56_10965, partial [Solirubrobacteraceae bacterium]
RYWGPLSTPKTQENPRIGPQKTAGIPVAMQKVEGSSPFIRFGKPALQAWRVLAEAFLSMAVVLWCENYSGPAGAISA